MITPTLPDGHFLASEGRDVPLVILEATGEPKFALLEHGLIPYAEWVATRPRPAGPAQELTLQSANGAFSGALEIR